MKADVTYRIAPQNRITRLRVRLKVEDGRSAVVNFDSPAAFLKRAETVDAELAEIFHEDLNVLADLEKQVHYRLDLDISASAMKEMGFPELGEPCDFEISFTKVPDEAHPNQLVAREVNSPVFPLSIKQNFTQQGLAERVGRIGFAASEVRDAGMNGSASRRRITEDEVEILFDPTKTVEKEEAEDLGFSRTCKSMRCYRGSTGDPGDMILTQSKSYTDRIAAEFFDESNSVSNGKACRYSCLEFSDERFRNRS